MFLHQLPVWLQPVATAAKEGISGQDELPGSGSAGEGKVLDWAQGTLLCSDHCFMVLGGFLMLPRKAPGHRAPLCLAPDRAGQ